MIFWHAVFFAAKVQSSRTGCAGFCNPNSQHIAQLQKTKVLLPLLLPQGRLPIYIFKCNEAYILENLNLCRNLLKIFKSRTHKKNFPPPEFQNIRIWCIDSTLLLPIGREILMSFLLRVTQREFRWGPGRYSLITR